MVDTSVIIRVIQQHDGLLAAKLVAQGECIVYAGYRNHDGYGKINRLGRVHFAHRWIYQGFYGAVPDGMKVLHRCDNPPCCNPHHLFLGTQQDNMRDMIKKGRARKADQRGRPGLKGESNPRAKLTKKQVAWIRRHYSPKYGSPFGSARLAERFGVSRNTVLAAVQGKTWRNA